MTRLVPLKSENKDLLKLESINSEAFPPTEYVSFDVLFRLSEEMDTDILGVYESETPVGFTVVVKNKFCAYIFLLAIDKNVRSKGYGSNTLQEVMKRYPDQQMILDFEELDLKAENYLQRVKRKAFYLRNGFHETALPPRKGTKRYRKEMNRRKAKEKRHAIGHVLDLIEELEEN